MMRQKKAEGMMFTIAMLVVGVFVAWVAITATGDKTESVDNIWNNGRLLACASPDGEGAVGFQVNSKPKKCPCDIDDEDAIGYKSKYYEVEYAVVKGGGAARNLFAGTYLDSYTEDVPFRISLDNIELIEQYINDKKRFDSGTLKDRPYIEFDYELNINLNSFFSQGRANPSLYTFCPSLKDAGQPETNCQKEIFYKDWFGDSPVAECYTPDDICRQRIEEECFANES